MFCCGRLTLSSELPPAKWFITFVIILPLPSLSFQKAKSSLESPRFLAVKHLDLSLMRDACASWTGILCLQLLYVHTLQYNTYSLLKNVSMNFPSSFKQDSSVGKDQRLIRSIPPSILTPEEKTGSRWRAGRRSPSNFFVITAPDASDLLPAPTATVRSQLGAP